MKIHKILIWRVLIQVCGDRTMFDWIARGRLARQVAVLREERYTLSRQFYGLRRVYLVKN